MNKTIVIIVSFFVLALIPLSLIAQEQDIESLQVGVQTASQLLVDLPVTHFEDADTWTSNMPVDQGLVFSMRRKGRPLEVPDTDPIDGTKNEYVLGVKVAFNHRSHANVSVRPKKPIKIPGITKALSIWVCGRSFRHRLYVHLIDHKGDEMMISLGLLDFAGWKRISIPVPATIKQEEYHNIEWRGVSFSGMTIQTDPEDSYGSFYVYFDELRAVTDIFQEENRDEDDMTDGW